MRRDLSHPSELGTDTWSGAVAEGLQAVEVAQRLAGGAEAAAARIGRAMAAAW